VLLDFHEAIVVLSVEYRVDDLAGERHDTWGTIVEHGEDDDEEKRNPNKE